MKKLFKRFGAYLIDILVVYLVCYVVCNLSFVNWQLDDYNKMYKEYEDDYVTYIGFTADLRDYYDDNELSFSEFEKLKKNYDGVYVEILEDSYKDEKLTKTNYNRVLKAVDKEFQKKYEVSYYNISKYSTFYNAFYVVCVVCYFVGGNIWFKGQTLGKKIFKLRIVSSNDNKDLKWYNYLVRALVLYNPIYFLLILIGPYLFGVSRFYDWSLLLENVRNYLEIIIIVMMVVRTDNRGLHDFLSGSCVVLLDSDIEVIKKSDDNNGKKRKKLRNVTIDSDE